MSECIYVCIFNIYIEHGLHGPFGSLHAAFFLSLPSTQHLSEVRKRSLFIGHHRAVFFNEAISSVGMIHWWFLSFQFFLLYIHSFRSHAESYSEGSSCQGPASSRWSCQVREWCRFRLNACALALKGWRRSSGISRDQDVVGGGGGVAFRAGGLKRLHFSTPLQWNLLNCPLCLFQVNLMPRRSAAVSAVQLSSSQLRKLRRAPSLPAIDPQLDGGGVGVIPPFLHVSYWSWRVGEKRQGVSVCYCTLMSVTQLVQPGQATTLISSAGFRVDWQPNLL